MTLTADNSPETALTAKSRYEALTGDREPFLRRARECALVTIPTLMPPRGSTGSTDLPTPYQGVGARGVNHLSAKMLLALFPPGGSFFRLTMDEFVRNELAAQAGDQVQDAFAEFESALSQIEQAVVTRLEHTGARMKIFEALRQLFNGGNFLIQTLDDGALRGHRLDTYVIKRDPSGTVQEIVVLEKMALSTAPESVRDLPEVQQAVGRQSGERDPVVSLYTWVRRAPKNWLVHQEVEDATVPGSEGTYPLDRPAWLPLRLNAVDGEDYGRGLCEEYLGDLQSLEALSQALVEGSAAAARILYLVDETGTTSAKFIAEAPNGAVGDGSANDVSVVQLNKFNDFRVPFEVAGRIEQRLAQVFLLFSDLPRHAERVTAEEIRQIVTELEDALGGVYSVLAEELQRPLAARVMHQMTRRKELPTLPKGAVSAQITTGLEALGRNHDLLKLDVLLEGLNATFGPEIVAEYVNVGAYIARRAAALGQNTRGLIRTEEEVQAARQEAQQAELAQSAVGPGMKFLGDRMAAGEQAAAQPEP